VVVLYAGNIWSSHLHQLVVGKYYPLIDHWLTQARVAWLFMSKMLLPVGLNSDRLVAWSTPYDVLGWVAFVSLIGMVATALVLYWGAGPRYAWCLAVLLLAAPLLMRFLHVNSEVYAEYRSYPSIPWACLLLSWGLVSLQARFQKFSGAGLLLVLSFVLLSALRSQEWSSKEKLCQSAVARSPLNIRPRNELLGSLVEERDLAPILKLQSDSQAAYQAILEHNQQNKSQRYDLWKAQFNIAICELLTLDAKHILNAPDYCKSDWLALAQRLAQDYPDAWDSKTGRSSVKTFYGRFLKKHGLAL
jgi:hypothetical protein